MNYVLRAWIRFGCAVCVGVAVHFGVTAQAADTEAVTRDEVLASVRVGDGGGCSGTIIAAGKEVAYGISAVHCGATIGHELKIGFVDGSIGSARWVAVDAKKDLALFVCWAADVLAVAPVADALPNDDPIAIGFPNGAGPKLSKVAHANNNGTNGSSPRAIFSLTAGEFGPGSSGGGIFRLGTLTSVTTNGWEGGPIHGCYHDDLIVFIKDHAALIREGAPLVQCVDGKCPKDKNGRWIPSPNTPIKLPKDGTFPDRESSKIIVALAKRIDDLESRLAALEKGAKGDVAPPPPPFPDPNKNAAADIRDAVDKWLSSNMAMLRGKDGVSGKDGQPGQNGQPGRDGQDGPAGRSGKDGTVSVILKWDNGDPIKTIAGLAPGSKVTVPLKKTISDAK